MKTMAMAIVTAVVGTSAWAKLPAAIAAPVVTVCVDRSPGGPDYMVEGEASKIFSAIPVTIVWKPSRKCQSSDAIRIRLNSRTPADLMPGALAFAQPYRGTYIEIFYDRVRTTVPAECVPHLLAYVLVHEITHILQGIARHSEAGIMKARWTADDYPQMWFDRLTFAPEDIWLIQRGLRSRVERLEAAADERESR
jgi:hypothetical protein